MMMHKAKICKTLDLEGQYVRAKTILFRAACCRIVSAITLPFRSGSSDFVKTASSDQVKAMDAALFDVEAAHSYEIAAFEQSAQKDINMTCSS